MKKLFPKLPALLILFIAFTVNTSAQENYSIDLVVFEPLPQIEFAAFAFSSDLSNTPRIFSIDVLPTSKRVHIEGEIEWQKSGNENFEFLYSFVTTEFTSRRLYNTDFGNAIDIKDEDNNSSLTDENLDRGKPTGSYKITLSLYDENNNRVATDTELLQFTNPAQTLTIRLPEAGSTQEVGAVIAEWEEIIGAESFTVKANHRKNRTQSLEEALDSGDPLIDDRNVGEMTSVNLRTILDREWLPGSEVVLQVIANIPGPSGGSKIESNIVNFYISDNTSPSKQEIKKDIVDLANRLPDNIAKDVLDKIASGDIKLEDLRVSLSDGTVLSYNELIQLLNKLKMNPDLIVRIEYKPN